MAEKNFVVSESKSFQEAMTKEETMGLLDPILKTINRVEKVNSLPSDAASNPKTLYMVVQ